jgi:hypothetical protein
MTSEVIDSHATLTGTRHSVSQDGEESAIAGREDDAGPIMPLMPGNTAEIAKPPISFDQPPTPEHDRMP